MLVCLRIKVDLCHFSILLFCRAEVYIQRGWRELFGALRLLVDVFTLFIVELLVFLLKTISERLVIRLINSISDFLLKPLLSALFNGIIQPLFAFTWNVLTGVRQLLQPLLNIIEQLFNLLATLFRAIRLCEINWGKRASELRPLKEV